jgi:hypothetical protein
VANQRALRIGAERVTGGDEEGWLGSINSMIGIQQLRAMEGSGSDSLGAVEKFRLIRKSLRDRYR